MGICHNHVGEVYFFSAECPYCERLRAKGQTSTERPRNSKPSPARNPTRTAKPRGALMGYPKKGDHVHAVGYWSGKAYDVTGIVDREGARVRSGAIMGRIIPDNGGKVVWIPWSTAYITFYRAE